MAKILITETVHESGPALLRAAGHEVIMVNRDMDVIRKEITDSDAVFTRILELPPSLLDTAKQLKIISKHGVGYDNIPMDYCREKGIAVTIAPGANSLSVAEHAFSLMLALSKNIIPVSSAYKTIGFAAKNSAPGIEVTGKTLGIIGLGRIGTLFSRMCRGFDLKVLAYDPYVHTAPDNVTLTDDLESMLREVDFLSLHANLTDETRKMINAERLAMMKPTAVLINCARGPIVDEPALIKALESGRLAAAGLDVTDPEPVEPDSPLLRLQNVIVTPHYAPTTLEAAIRVSTTAAQNIIDYLNGTDPEGRIA